MISAGETAPVPADRIVVKLVASDSFQETLATGISVNARWDANHWWASATSVEGVFMELIKMGYSLVRY